jgi:membrane fusion protein (multidrug efflux system)
VSDAEGYNAIAASEVEAAGKRPRESWLYNARWPLMIGGPLLILAIVAYFVLTGGRYQTTDNAYIQIGKAPVSASVAGRVVTVYVRENQRVKAGEKLFQLDPRDFTANTEQARAQVAQAELQVRSLRAAYAQQQATLLATQETLTYSDREAARQKALMAAGVASRQQYDEAVHTAQLARQQIAVAREQAAAARANLNGDPNIPVEQHPSVLAARAALARAELNKSYGDVLAPTDGVVTRVDQLQPGAYVNASQTVFWLLAGKPWVEANFKEDQLAHMKVGQPVEIKLDAYPDAKLTGRVASFSPGTGSVFSALPAQNATGNWVKVTQRLPVQIDFDGQPPLQVTRAGLSAHVKVDVRAPAKAGAPA